MNGNAASDSGAVEHKQGGDHGDRTPAAPAGDDRTDAGLAIDSGEQLLRVDDDRLDLGDQEHPDARMPRQDVNAAPLAVVVERQLDVDQPSVPAQAFGPDGFYSGMVGIKEARKIAAGHAQLERHVASTGHDSLAQRVERMTTDVARFEAGYH